MYCTLGLNLFKIVQNVCFTIRPNEMLLYFFSLKNIYIYIYHWRGVLVYPRFAGFQFHPGREVGGGVVVVRVGAPAPRPTLLHTRLRLHLLLIQDSLIY